MTDFDFDQEVSKAHLAAAGWKLNDFISSNPTLCHMFYVRDFRTGHIQLFTITRDAFEQLRVPFSAAELSSSLADLMHRLAGGCLTPEESKVLPGVLAGYVKGTQSYRIWNSTAGGDDRLHAVVNVYPGGTVRPFIEPPVSTVLPAEKILADTDAVRAMDLANHPEWFR